MEELDDNNNSSQSQNSEMDEQAIQSLEVESKCESTTRSTVYGIKRFKEWLNKRGLECNFGTVTAEELNELLRKFYAEIKGKKGGSLTPSTLTCLRAAIHRHLTSAPFSRCINIIRDRQFTSANNIFMAKCKLYFKAGNKKPQHKPVIGDGDMQKLNSYFLDWNKSPDKLIESVWFYLCYYFGRRGREGWASMSINSFESSIDSEGFQFVHMINTETTKNHQGGHKQADIDYTDQRMYGPGVERLEFLKTKLNPESDRLFQHPLKSYLLDQHWFRKEPMGKNTLGNMMQRISKKAGLSQVFTCHSVRASTITVLHQAGL